MTTDQSQPIIVTTVGAQMKLWTSFRIPYVAALIEFMGDAIWRKETCLLQNSSFAYEE